MADQDIKNEIIERNRVFMETFKEGDYTGMGELYTEDGQVLPPNALVVKGKSDISNFWKATMDMGVKSIQIETDEVEQFGDTAIEVSQASLFGEGNQLIDDAKYIVIWKRENGAWKLHRDIFNSNKGPGNP